MSKGTMVGSREASKMADAALIPLITQFYPTLGIRTIAKIAVKNHSEVFPNIESARNAIRIRIGHRGAESRNAAHRNPEITKLHSEIEAAECKWPDEIEEWVWQPYALPQLDGLWLIIADLHIPFHKMQPIMTTINYAKSLGKELKGILLNGDIADQYNASWWAIDPKVVTLEKELMAVREFFYKLRAEFPKREIVWKMANHEYRFEKTFLSKNPSWASSESIRNQMLLINVLKAGGNEKIFDGIKIVDPFNLISFKNLAIIHGDEISSGMGNPVSPARTLYLKAKACAWQNHSHQSSGYTKADIWGTQVVTKSGGCLCHLHPKWKPFAHIDWNWGFGVLDTRGKWDLDNKRILEGDKVVSA